MEYKDPVFELLSSLEDLVVERQTDGVVNVRLKA